MKCPNCEKPNADANKYCWKCGNQLPTPSKPVAVRNSDPITGVAIYGGITYMVGGALTVLGWLFPWFSLGGLVNTLLSFLNESLR